MCAQIAASADLAVDLHPHSQHVHLRTSLVVSGSSTRSTPLRSPMSALFRVGCKAVPPQGHVVPDGRKRACIGMQLLLSHGARPQALPSRGSLHEGTIAEPLFMNTHRVHLRFIPRLTSAPPPPLTATCLTVDVSSSDLAPSSRYVIRSSLRPTDPTCEGPATHLVGRVGAGTLVHQGTPSTCCLLRRRQSPLCHIHLHGLPPVNVASFHGLASERRHVSCPEGGGFQRVRCWGPSMSRDGRPSTRD